MADDSIVYRRNHRRQQQLLAGFSAAFLLLTIAPRQERALFIINGAGFGAFGATVPPFDLSALRVPLDFLPGAPRAFFARTPLGPVGPGGLFPPAAPVGTGGPAGGPGFTPAAPGPGAPTGFGPSPTPGALPPIDNGFPFAPPTLGGPTESPVVPITDQPVTPAVPEPATWSMMIAGLMLVGSVLRRRRSSRATTASAA